MGTSSLAFLQQNQVTFSLFRQQPSRVWQLHPFFGSSQLSSTISSSSSSYKPWLGNHNNRRAFLLHLQQQQRHWQTTKTTWSSLYSSYSSSSSSLSSTETFQPTTTTMTNNSQTNKKKYKIAIVGAGAVGSYYGARLWEAGHDVQFYTRTKPKDSLAVVTETTKTTTTTNENNENCNGTDGSNHKNNDDGAGTTTGTTDHIGLHVSSIEGDIYIPTKEWHVFNDTTKMQIADWIVVALKSSSLDAIPNLIVPLFRQDCTTRVLVIMNGLIEDDLIQLLQTKTTKTTTTKKKKKEDGLQPNTTTTTGAAATEPHHPKQQQQQLSCCKALYGGMALICSNRLSSHRIDHSYAGLLSAGVATSTSTTTTTTRTTTSSFLGMKHKDNDDDNDEENENDEIAFRNLFVGTKVPITYESNLLRGRWKKMVWNLPFNGISVAMGGITVDQIVQDPGLRQLAIHIMDETILIANTELQHIYGDSNNNKNNNNDDDKNDDKKKKNDNNNNNNNPSFFVSWQPLGNVEKEQMMNLSDNMGPYKTSTMLDLTNRRAMEVQYMFREPLQRAQRLGVPVPYLQTIVTLIEAYQRKYNLY